MGVKMMLRDQFAMAAMQGELASQTSNESWESEQNLASRAYKVANAMMQERAKQDFSNDPDVAKMITGVVVSSKSAAKDILSERFCSSGGFDLDWTQAPANAVAWEYLGHGAARWITAKAGYYESAPLFGYPYNGRMVYVPRPAE